MWSCEKCGHKSEENMSKFERVFCSVCHLFAPETKEEVDEYAEEKISPEFLDEMEKLRKYSVYRGKLQKRGMLKKASEGKHMSRIPFGYEWSEEKNKLVPAKNYHEVEDIFNEFLKNDAKLSHIAKKHNLSVNGLKKVLRNFAYMGKVKFDGQIHEGEHEAIIDSTTFNKVQDKLDILEKQRKQNKEDKNLE